MGMLEEQLGEQGNNNINTNEEIMPFRERENHQYKMIEDNIENGRVVT